MIDDILQDIAALDSKIYDLQEVKREADAALKHLQVERDTLSARAINAMLDTGCVQAVVAGYKWGLRNNPPKPVVTDENLIPARFWMIKKELDKKGLNEAFKAGEDIPGVVLDNGSVSLVSRAMEDK